jgi:hypothetical protein
VRAAAGRYVLALLKQAWADESNGRAKWKALPYFGGGSESAAREFRKELAKRIGENPAAELLDAELWLINTEMLAENTAAGVKGLVKNASAKKTEAYRGLLAPAHPNKAVVTAVLQDAGARKLALGEQAAALCSDYRADVRAAAREAAGAMGVKELPEFKAEKSLEGFVAGELKAISEMVLTPAPKEATWKRFSVKVDTRTFERSGWLLAEDKSGYRVLDMFGTEDYLERDKTTVTDRTMAEDVAAILEYRGAKGDERRNNPLSARGMLTGQFEPGFVSLPEALLAAWAMERGDAKDAAAVILPCFDRAADARWIRQATRDLMARGYHDKLLGAFTGQRDYAEAIRIGTHLGKPAFEGWQYYERTKTLTAQLQKRGEDFKTLTLPTPAEWTGLQAKLDRPAQVEYLAKRLKLLNAFQWGQPGGVDFEGRQTREPLSPRRGGEGADAGIETINPLVTLAKMELAVKDIPVLLPYVDDEDFILAYGYWRDFHPGRTLYPVKAFAVQLIDQTACRELMDWAAYARSDAAGKKAMMDEARKWVAEHARLSRADLLLKNLQELKDPDAVVDAAQELTARKQLAALPVIFERMGNIGEAKARESLAECCFRLAPEKSVEQARKWIKEGEGVKFWGAMILFTSGDKEKQEGFAEIKALLDGDDHELTNHKRAFDTLLKSGRKEAIDLAAGVFKHDDGKLRNDELRPFAHRLFLAGRQEALDYLLKALDNKTPYGTRSTTVNGKQVSIELTQGDEAAENLRYIRSDKWEYPAEASEKDRAAEREKLKTWLKEQMELIRAGKPSGIRTDVGDFSFPRWMLDAPR